MSDLQIAAKAALWAFQCHVEQTWPIDRSTAAITALRAALAESERDWSMLEAAQEALREHMAEIHRLRAAMGQQQTEPETCTWQQDGDSDSGLYGTSCRHYFRLEDGTPEDNKMAHCCYCGKKLVQELITEDGDE